MGEGESVIGQHLGCNALTEQNHFLGHLAADPTRREGGYLQDRRAVHGPAQSRGELTERDGARRTQVHRSGQVGVEEELDGADLVDQADPREVLLAVADRSAEPELEQRPEFAQQAALGAEDRRRTEQDQTRVRADAGGGGALPVDDQVGEESLAGAVGLDRGVATGVPVIARGAGTHERRDAEIADGLGEQFGGGDPRVPEFLFEPAGPATVADSHAAQRDHRLDAVETLRRDADRLGIPAELVIGACLAADQTCDRVARRAQRVDQGVADESR